MKTLWIGLFCVVGLGLSGVAGAVDFPNRPVHLIVPVPPGGSMDVEGRLIAAKLHEKWHQPVIVENRSGAGTTIGVDYVARSAPDGYTLVLNAMLILATPQLQHTPYDVMRDLTGVVQTSLTQLVLAANPKAGVSTIGELVELAKKNPGRLNYGSGGVGSGPHLYTALLTNAAKIDLTHVPYKGEGPGVQALLAGDIDVYFANVATVIPFVKAGKLRALMITGDKPFAGLPDVPAFNAVYPGFSGPPSWHGIFAPTGTPKAVIDLIAADVREALLSPDLMSRFHKIGFEPTGVLADPFNEIVRRDYQGWGQVIRANNIHAD
jgi:tripartite-type tricarboxylate transporter receptor subunit TctC